MAKEKDTVGEQELLKALNDLEEYVEKGDALQAADHDGGFATEGDDIRTHAKQKNTIKAMSASDDDGDDDEGEDEGGEDEDEGEEDEMAMSKTKKKVKKSFRETLDDDEDMAKALEVSDFLEGLVGNVGDHLDENALNTGALRKAIVAAREQQHNFNTRLAKALVVLGKEQREIRGMLDQVLDAPASPPQRRGVINKSEVIDRPQLDGLGEGLGNVNPEAVRDWLVNKAMAGEVEMLQVTVFEQSGYDVRSLPDNIQKSLESDLVK